MGEGAAITETKLLLASVLVVVAASGLIMALTLRQGLEGRTLVAGVSPDLPPLEFWANGTIRGISVDVLEYAARHSGYSRIRYVSMPYPELLQAVANGSVDVALGIAFSDESIGKALLTMPYYNLTIWVTCISGGCSPQSIDDLEGMRVGYLKGDRLAANLLYSLRIRYGYNVTVVELSLGSPASSSKVSLSRVVDAIVYTRRPPTCTSGCVELELRYSFAVARNDAALLAKLNDSIEEAWSRGILELIAKKYVG